MTKNNDQPIGWTLVPNRINYAMQEAYFAVIDKNLPRVEKDATFGRYTSNAEAYQDMIAAAPTPPKRESSELTSETKPANEWQPIETAPKDGTEITGGWAYPFHDYSGVQICWQKGNNHEGWFMLIPHPWGEKFIFGTYPGRWIKEVEFPTHWMPKMPEPKRNDVEVGPATQKPE